MNRTLLEQNLANGYRIIPTQPNKPKWAIKGSKHTDRYSVADFNGGRGTKLIAGKQFNDLFVVEIDDDLQGAALLRIEHSEPTLYARLPIFDSTNGRGKHACFVSPVTIESGTGWCDKIEVKADNGQGITAPNIDLTSLPVLTEEEVRRILDCIGYKPRQRPQAATPATPAATSGHTSDKDAIAAYNANTDLCELLESFGAQRSGRGLMFHCSCGQHKHGDKEASLSVVPSRTSRNGAYVVIAHAPACTLYGTHHAFDVYKLSKGLTVKEALAELNPLGLSFDTPRHKPHKATPAPISDPPAPAVDNSPDALRKQRERATQRDIVITELKAQIVSDTRLKPRAVDLADALLQCGKLQCDTVNKELSERTGYSERTITTAFAELTKAGYGKRIRIGYDPILKWSWTPYTSQQFNAQVNKLRDVDLYVQVGEHSQNESHINSAKETSERKNGNQSGVVESSTSIPDLVHAALELAYNTQRKVSFKFVLDFVKQYAEKVYTDDAIKYHYTKLIAQNQYARQRARLEEKARNMSIAALNRAAKATGSTAAQQRRKGKENKAKVFEHLSGTYEAEITRREKEAPALDAPLPFSSSLVSLQDMPEPTPQATDEQPELAPVIEHRSYVVRLEDGSISRIVRPPARKINKVRSFYTSA